MKARLDRDAGHPGRDGGHIWVATLEDPVVGDRDIAVHVPGDTLVLLQRQAVARKEGGDWLMNRIEAVVSRVADDRPSRFDMFLTSEDFFAD